MVLFLNCDFFFFAFSFIHTFPSFYYFFFLLHFVNHTRIPILVHPLLFFLYFHLIPEAPHSFFLQLSEVFLLSFFFSSIGFYFFVPEAPHSFYFFHSFFLQLSFLLSASTKGHISFYFFSLFLISCCF